MKSFTDSAKALAKNPLGILALFLVLVYGMATLLFGVSADSLSAEERCVILSFVVLFPVLVLAAFYRLVTKHHNKLYAPGDWKDETHFLQAMSIEIPAPEDLSQEGERGLTTITDRTFTNETVTLDGQRFERCHFKKCKLKFRGTKAVQLDSCIFDDVKWVFGGNAALTINFVSALYKAMGDDVKRPFLDSIIGDITGTKKLGPP